jgi:hypothetical protein
MVGRAILATALLGLSIGSVTACRAEGALVIAMPDDDPNRGFRWTIKVNHPEAASEAMDSCQSDRRIAAYCTLVKRFSDQCVAVAVNGGPTDSVSAAAWAFAMDSAAATRDAIAQCEAKRNGRGIACGLDQGPNGALFCDGTAK